MWELNIILKGCKKCFIRAGQLEAHGQTGKHFDGDVFAQQV
jgi:hypothetical protein